MISLKEVDKTNWIDCVRLSLHPEQENFVASNSDTIAESKFETHHQVRAIYNDDTVIGLLSYCHEDEPLDLTLYWLFRFMIDKQYQGQGYGHKALELAVGEMTSVGANRIQTMHKPSNHNAAALYRNYGFEEIGTLDDGDTLLQLKVAC